MTPQELAILQQVAANHAALAAAIEPLSARVAVLHAAVRALIEAHPDPSGTWTLFDRQIGQLLAQPSVVMEPTMAKAIRAAAAAFRA